ncbi:hypothetical protein F7734_49000 [Scytonema sp. UIC 10036]|uniref:hypothetical protein n=1 Tax=Scytonema sp. UIC 10036 TaxID=2304196 RepID=UPI0012DAE24B|nr:hypothetical protein [Scytonema sp. UIC 10036]MUG99796.1 hypothetical protein [Scytonema sp. UIC 10036]
MTTISDWQLLSRPAGGRWRFSEVSGESPFVAQDLAPDGTIYSSIAISNNARVVPD